MYNTNQLNLHIRWVLDKPTAPGWRDKRNTTGLHTLYWIHEGRGTFHTDRSYPVHGGMLAYMLPGLQMDMESDELYPLQMTMILFDCAEVDYDEPSLRITRVTQLELPFLRTFHSDKMRELSLLFQDIYRSWVPGVAGGAMLSQAKLLSLLYDLHSATESQVESAHGAVEQVKQYLETSYNTDFKIHELAERFGISLSYLRKMLHKAVGMSPKHYHTHIRHEHARHYLMYSSFSVKEIAEVCGYLDEYHFSKSFKQFNGVSPSAFRMAFKGAD
ncbi:AraC family transcriptional regulator [Paenibacillus qinlingensis]|uniref:AraC-like DNA-binding protein n=1 Tax=Paenibacillus qinlingensis TaxID=1837343 RepID=A0ABU1NTN8_9BACL|nr:AraC family transcriptional regulator [Paenibacillus qinlingensis]MDR6550848.1 AraC-like DNA-binding protein [Paenibacillus qinlingensis]